MRRRSATSAARAGFLPPVHRRGVLIALGAVLFLVVSFQLARFLTADGAERAAVFALLEDEARGDAPAVVRRLEGCGAACAAQVASIVARVRRPGEVKILRLDSGARYTLGERMARSRVAWAADAAAGGEAVVQCVTVRRRWSLTSGSSVTLLRLGAPLPLEKSC